MPEHYVLRSCAYSQSEMFVVRDVYDRPARNMSFEDGGRPMPALLRIEWLTPGGWIKGKDGGYPPLYGTWELMPLFAEALTGFQWEPI